MSWPLPQDFNEAVQNPAISFSDSDLMTGQAVVGPTGLPLPRSGNFADVYQVRAANGRDWAVKCFTRPVTGLDQRYRKLDEALRKAGLPFTIGFAFLNQGVMVHGKWHPALKMEWVDGLQLNQAVRVQAGSPKVLDALVQMWSRLCKKLREAGIAHADLQHGNVLLVAGSKAGTYSLKLIDYDGMFTPSLANTPSGESGHPNYQHPQRAAKGVYSPDLDRFPHLVIATALKGLAVCGQKLWEKYDTGDNLLFTEDDIKAPASSALMKELWEKNDSALQSLVGHLAIACGKAIPQTPWLDQIAPEGVPIQLTPEQARAAAATLGVPPPAWANVVVPVAPAEYSVELVAPAPVLPPPPANAFSNLEDSDEVVPVEPKSRRRVRDEEPAEKKKSLAIPLAIGGGVLALVLAVVVGIVVFGGNKPDETAQQKNDDDKEKEKPKPPPVKEKDKPKPPDPTPPDPTPPKKPIEPPMAEPVGFNFDPANVPELKSRWIAFTTGNAVLARFTANGEYVIARDGTAKDAKAKDVRVFAATSGTAQTGFTEGVTNLVDFACLSDGNVASWHLDQPFAFVWNPATGKKASRLPVRTPPDNAGPKLFDVSPDGRYVVAGHAMSAKSPELGSIVVSEVETGKEILSAPVRHPKFRFHEDQFILADTEQVQFYKLPSGRPGRSAKFGNVSRTLKMLGCSADGSLVLHPGNGDPQLIDCRAGGVLAVFPPRFTSSFGALSDDGRFAAAISPQDRMNGEPMAHVEVLDIAAKKLLGRFILGQAPDVTSMSFAPDNSALVITRSGRRVQVIDLPKAGAVAVTPKMKDPDPMPVDPPASGDFRLLWTKDITGVAANVWFTPDGKHLFVNSMDSSDVTAHDLATGAKVVSFKGPAGNRAWRSFTKLDDGRVFGSSETSRLFDFKTGDDIGDGLKQSWLPPGQPQGLGYFLLAPDGKSAFTARTGVYKKNTDTNQFDPVPAPYRFVDTASGKDILAGEWRSGAAKFTADSKALLLFADGAFKRVGVGGSHTDVWNVSPRVASSTRFMDASDDGSVLFIFGELPNTRHGFHVVEAKTGRAIRTLEGSYLPQWMRLSHDGKQVGIVRMYRGTGNTLHFTPAVIDVDSGAVVREAKFEIDVNRLVRMEFSPDLQTFAFSERESKKVSVYAFKSGAVAVTPKMKDPDPMPKDPPGVAGEGYAVRWSKPVKSADSRISFSPDDKQVLLLDPKATPWQLDAYGASNGVLDRSYPSDKGQGSSLMKVATLGDGRLFGISGLGSFFEWDAKSGAVLPSSLKPEWFPKGGSMMLPFVEYAPNGKFVFIGNDGEKIYTAGQLTEHKTAPYVLIDVGTGSSIASGEWGGGTVAFSADSKWMAVFDGRGRLFRINTETGKSANNWDVPSNTSSCELKGLSRDGTIALLTGRMPNTNDGVHVVDLAASRVLLTMKGTRYGSYGGLTPDGKYAVSVLMRSIPGPATAPDLVVYEVATNRIVRRASFEKYGQLYGLSFSSDLSSFAAVDESGSKAVVYDFKSGTVAVVPKMKDPDPPIPMPKPKDPSPKIERAAVPDAAAIAKAEMKLHTLFKDEYAKKEPVDRRNFATKLLGLADGENDDAAQRYVMYRDARDIASDLFEPPLAMRALDGIFRHYTADADAMRLETFEKIKNQPKVNNTALKYVAEFALAASESALAADNYSYALKYAQTAADAVKRGNLVAALRDEAAALTAKAQKGAETFKPVQQALEELTRNPGNRDAAYTVGQYRCFQQGRWEDGIKNLAAGAVGDVKTAALQDAAAPRTGPADVKIADAWWQASQSAIDTVEKQGSLYRARHWYALALSGLKDDARKTAESRLAFSAGGTDYKPGLIAGFTAKVPAILKDQKARVDSVLDFNAGEFKGTDASGAATDLEVKWSGAILVQRAGRYRIVVAATDPVVVRIDGRIVIDTNSKGSRLDAMVSLPDRPVAIEVSFKSINTDRHSVKLLWSLPGVETEEPVPPEALIHDKKAESVLGKLP